VTTRLGSVTSILAVSVLWQERTAEQTLDLLGPLWEWLLRIGTASSTQTVKASTKGQDLIHATG
jgi:hypothetical protein